MWGRRHFLSAAVGLVIALAALIARALGWIKGPPDVGY